MTNYNVLKTYEKIAKRDCTPEQKLGWTSRDMQQQNYALLTQMLLDINVILPGLTLHDAGCGTGDLLEYLQQESPGGESLMSRKYIGTDFMESVLTLARERFPSHDFRRHDLLQMQSPPADVTMICGSLAYHKPRDVEKLLLNLWSNTQVAMAFNTWWELDKKYFYHDSIEQLRKVIHRFLRGKDYEMQNGAAYGQPTEACFVVYR